MSVANMIREDMQTDEFWAGIAKFEFMIAISKTMTEKGISKSDLARLIGKSPAYVTKIMTGDCNLTIESMVTISRAIGMKFTPLVTEDTKPLSSSNVVTINYNPKLRAREYGKVYCHG